MIQTNIIQLTLLPSLLLPRFSYTALTTTSNNSKKSSLVLAQNKKQSQKDCQLVTSDLSK